MDHCALPEFSSVFCARYIFFVWPLHSNFSVKLNVTPLISAGVEKDGKVSPVGFLEEGR